MAQAFVLAEHGRTATWLLCVLPEYKRACNRKGEFPFELSVSHKFPIRRRKAREFQVGIDTVLPVSVKDSSGEGVDKPCIYLQLDSFEDANAASNDADSGSDSTPEVRLVPSDPECCKSPFGLL